MFNTNCFAHGIAQSIGDTAIAYALTAARWGVLGAEWYYEAFFSANAQQRYRLIGEIVGHCLILGLLAWRMAQQWADDEVQEAMIADDVIVEIPCSFYTDGEKYWSYGEDCYVQSVAVTVSRSFHWEEDWELLEAVEAGDNRVKIAVPPF
ncbi:hypothetical protein H6F75_00490 [Nodosilinea sp. FACHB-131]|uniref:hypothetical protein n=1 Tax=Cyanophyceae TaxID=3028117 RepID=UPI001687658D|nr:hypothetical protein [Nodosilinea sp. FACHB-131]MBD1871948.1 hypothetical protein [Nodosilinea sp. FACHB-131]